MEVAIIYVSVALIFALLVVASVKVEEDTRIEWKLGGKRQILVEGRWYVKGTEPCEKWY